jgi:hypothetical protein
LVQPSPVPTQLCAQLPPLHENVHVAPFAQSCVQPSPEQLKLQIAFAAHVCVQPPPEQSKLHVAPGVHACVQCPPGHASSGSPSPAADVDTEHANESAPMITSPQAPRMVFISSPP